MRHARTLLLDGLRHGEWLPVLAGHEARRQQAHRKAQHRVLGCAAQPGHHALDQRAHALRGLRGARVSAAGGRAGPPCARGRACAGPRSDPAMFKKSRRAGSDGRKCRTPMGETPYE
jgi:hypothetical protein